MSVLDTTKDIVSVIVGCGVTLTDCELSEMVNDGKIVLETDKNISVVENSGTELRVAVGKREMKLGVGLKGVGVSSTELIVAEGSVNGPSIVETKLEGVRGKLVSETSVVNIAVTVTDSVDSEGLLVAKKLSEIDWVSMGEVVGMGPLEAPSDGDIDTVTAELSLTVSDGKMTVSVVTGKTIVGDSSIVEVKSRIVEDCKTEVGDNIVNVGVNDGVSTRILDVGVSKLKLAVAENVSTTVISAVGLTSVCVGEGVGVSICTELDIGSRDDEIVCVASTDETKESTLVDGGTNISVDVISISTEDEGRGEAKGGVVGIVDSNEVEPIVGVVSIITEEEGESIVIDDATTVKVDVLSTPGEGETGGKVARTVELKISVGSVALNMVCTGVRGEVNGTVIVGMIEGWENTSEVMVPSMTILLVGLIESELAVVT